MCGDEQIMISDFVTTIRRIRDHITRTETYNLIYQKKYNWNMLCVSLGTFQDTEEMIQYFRESEFPEDVRGKFLAIYGLLQALFVQKDALLNANAALELPNINLSTDFPGLHSIREMRNDVVGHPTKRDQGKKKPDDYTYFQLARDGLSKSSFKYVTWNNEIRGEITEVDVMMNLDKQHEEVIKGLNNISEALDVKFKEYIDAHRERKMIDIFAQYGYVREKLLSEPLDESCSVSDESLAAVEKIIADYKSELDQRYGSWEKVGPSTEILREIDEHYAIISIREADFPEDIRCRQMRCSAESLCRSLDILRDYSIETDKYFETYDDLFTSTVVEEPGEPITVTINGKPICPDKE
ncbi:MAG: hypothetical protein Q7J08_00745 [Methanocorpusculum sp.]|uniref:hypothetical protein n=1 Tax=Methanocorpusculum sp. TaxID=2058474 RepID=UPI002715EEDF|nr:hypothetical protein [Methanocorpusculum sp.]MDO9522227.1 hypothetical protein [Methanocorpusculum sp.]